VIGAGANGRLTLSVEDDGVGLGAGQSGGHGIGLSATRERLQHMYGRDSALDVRAREGGGTRVSIDLPLRRQDRKSA
jgi:sensor histidine kinase YesM